MLLRAKQQQEKVNRLSKSLNYTRAIIRTIREPFLVLDEDLRVISANKSFYKTFQVREEDTEGSLVYELGNKQWDIPSLRKLLEEILPNNSYFDDYEVEHDFLTIGHKAMLLNARRFYEDGEHILLVFEDITLRKEIDERKNDFIAIASHELKSPLTSVVGFMRILRQRLEQGKDNNALSIAKKVDTQVGKLYGLVNDLLDARKMKMNKLILNKELFSLDVLVKGVVEAFQYGVESHTIEHKCEAKVQVYADRRRVEQAVTNLIDNAIKYSPEGTNVIVTVSSDKDNAILAVRDFGIGIGKYEQEHIFEPFFRAKEGEERFLGLGLGLHIAHDIIKRHKGKLWVESTKGKGTTFYLSLPIESKAME